MRKTNGQKNLRIVSSFASACVLSGLIIVYNEKDFFVYILAIVVFLFIFLFALALNLNKNN